MALHTETAAYKLETTRNGGFVVLTRQSDGADVHFQGNAATQVLEEVEELADCWPGSPKKFIEFFDYLMSQYDELMEIRS